jgi:hypothetical protein
LEWSQSMVELSLDYFGAGMASWAGSPGRAGVHQVSPLEL